MTARWTLPAFCGYGIELEYMIVDRESLDVRPVASDFLRGLAGGAETADVARGELGWSNELASHVVELKNVAPTTAFPNLAAEFQAEVCTANSSLAPLAARLMPTGMHPWMQPAAETVIWARQGREIYELFDRIFDCRRHGWANIQSMQVNLPFADDFEFTRLHAALRLLLPLLPALAASSPLVEGKASGFMDFRVDAYCNNASRVPAVVGDVIPETIVGRDDYHRRILEPMYQEIARHDSSGTLRHEWLNARGAISRFDRSAIELRLLDMQEHPGVDVAIAAAVVTAAKLLYLERWSTLSQQQALSTAALLSILRTCTREAEQAIVDERSFLELLGITVPRCTAAEVWAHILGGRTAADAWWHPSISFILNRGTLARRILTAISGDYSRTRLREVYAILCDCLEQGKRFE